MTPRSRPAPPAADSLREALVTQDVGRAVEVLRAGGLVGLPTETVYGLAADAQDVAAVGRVFTVKGRPADHPLIVHVAAADDLDRWAEGVPAYARRLVGALWPGPLTLVVPRSRLVGDHVTGGQPTVGLRCPAHPVAHAVLAAFGGGVAAPSANRFGRVSPTTAQHVLDELGDRLDPARDVVLDGGPSTVGVESTILDCTGPAPRLLRSGAVTAAAVLEAGGVPVVGRRPAGAGTADGPDGDGPDGDTPDGDTPDGVRAPGMLAAHYAPLALVVVARTPADVAAALAGTPAGRSALLAPAAVPTPPGVVRLAAPPDTAAYAHALYAALRAADELGLDRVVAVPPEGGELADAVLDRLRRAAVGSSRHQPFG
ncbi:L-threonylcarbamoyladenylate synthase [Kineosporia sp. R_H_3]|uniref:L-threonylcarbamoyladenylate synthase n=1 Tax=Kineosporia sp. R_H_3 TaxID=1961848 RepID=UPI000B4AD404|nr:L-threonylcarbamoyladenylate synthase [Kineosporia sp. R_H_3]